MDCVARAFRGPSTQLRPVGRRANVLRQPRGRSPDGSSIRVRSGRARVPALPMGQRRSLVRGRRLRACWGRDLRECAVLLPPTERREFRWRRAAVASRSQGPCAGWSTEPSTRPCRSCDGVPLGPRGESQRVDPRSVRVAERSMLERSALAHPHGPSLFKPNTIGGDCLQHHSQREGRGVARGRGGPSGVDAQRTAHRDAAHASIRRVRCVRKAGGG